MSTPKVSFDSSSASVASAPASVETPHSQPGFFSAPPASRGVAFLSAAPALPAAAAAAPAAALEQKKTVRTLDSWDFNVLLTASDQDLESSFRLGLLFGILGNKKLAEQCFQRILMNKDLKEDDPLKVTTNACRYHYGVGVDSDWSKSEKLFAEGAKKGNPTAQDFFASSCFRKGDTKNGMYWLNMAASNGEPFAQCTLGEICSGSTLYNVGISLLDDKKANEWLEKSAQQGLSYGKHQLALRYERKGEHARAVELYEQSALQMNESSMLALLSLYRTIYRPVEAARMLRDSHFVCGEFMKGLSNGCARRLNRYLINPETLIYGLDPKKMFAIGYYTASLSPEGFEKFFEESQKNQQSREQLFDLLSRDINSPIFAKITTLKNHISYLANQAFEQADHKLAAQLALCRVSGKLLQENYDLGFILYHVLEEAANILQDRALALDSKDEKGIAYYHRQAFESMYNHLVIAARSPLPLKQVFNGSRATELGVETKDVKHSSWDVTHECYFFSKFDDLKLILVDAKPAYAFVNNSLFYFDGVRLYNILDDQAKVTELQKQLQQHDDVMKVALSQGQLKLLEPIKDKIFDVEDRIRGKATHLLEIIYKAITDNEKFQACVEISPIIMRNFVNGKMTNDDLAIIEPLIVAYLQQRAKPLEESPVPAEATKISAMKP